MGAKGAWRNFGKGLKGNSKGEGKGGEQLKREKLGNGKKGGMEMEKMGIKGKQGEVQQAGWHASAAV